MCFFFNTSNTSSYQTARKLFYTYTQNIQPFFTNITEDVANICQFTNIQNVTIFSTCCSIFLVTAVEIIIILQSYKALKRKNSLFQLLISLKKENIDFLVADAQDFIELMSKPTELSPNQNSISFIDKDTILNKVDNQNKTEEDQKNDEEAQKQKERIDSLSIKRYANNAAQTYARLLLARCLPY